MQAAGPGSFVQGFIQTATSSFIDTTSGGSGGFAQGRAGNGGRIRVSGQGGFAQGNANTNDIIASASGAFAVGNASSGDILASAVNAAQFGPGTNSVANSLQVGGLGAAAGFRALATGQHGSPNIALTLGAGVTTFAASSNVMTITGDALANTIATITGGTAGQLLTLIFVDALVTITDDNAHTADSADLSAAFTSVDDTVLQLVYDGTSWYEVSRSAN